METITVLVTANEIKELLKKDAIHWIEELEITKVNAGVCGCSWVKIQVKCAQDAYFVGRLLR